MSAPRPAAAHQAPQGGPGNVGRPSDSLSRLSLAHVFQRSPAGQALHWGAGELPQQHERVLMRLTGYTPLVRLVDPREDAEQLLGIVEDLLGHGLVELVDNRPTEAPASTWGELALALSN